MTGRETTRRRVLRRAAIVLTGLITTSTSTACGPETIGEFLSRTVPDQASLTVLVARKGKVVYCKGFGHADREADLFCSCDTAFDIGSVTKQFTAAAILKLHMAGRLSISDPLAEFFDGLPADMRTITLHQLLTHTSGLADQLGDDYDPTSRQDLIEATAESRLLWEPGTKYRYSNLGYSMLAAVIERTSGAGYEKYLATQLFAPAGMRHTGYVLPNWHPEQVAMQYDAQGKPMGRPNALPWDADGPWWNLRGNGGILSTARDMCRWYVALDGTTVLSNPAKRKLFQPYVRESKDGETHYGYGWVILRDDVGNRIAWHNGGNTWSYSEFAISLDEDLMVFWATNQVQRRPEWNLEDLDLTQGMLARLRV